ncbi:MAG: leucine--tRNA ligase [Actinomycetota bacterium]
MSADIPAHRYDASRATEIELKWQQQWLDDGTYETANTGGILTGGNRPADPDAGKLFVMDMFPYPSGSGLHVGHPLGFIGTDVFARFKRMTGHHVLHTMGFDAFGLPAEEHARQTGQHPRENTEANVATYRRQLKRLGLGHDQRRSVSTTDVAFYRWTQWIFLQIFNSWYDDEKGKARPIAELEAAFADGSRPTPDGRPWAELSVTERRRLLNDHRLAYVDEAPVNWCPGLGTVLANEEVTVDGRSERGNHPVFRRPLKQWMMRITSYADRLLADLDRLDWTDAIKTMQRNWIGRSEGARIDFPVATGNAEGATGSEGAEGAGETITVFTTRPDTVFGATYMVLAPEHPLVDTLTADAWPEGTKDPWTGGAASPTEAVGAYRAAAAQKSDLDRQENKEKTGVFTGAFAVVPTTGAEIPVFIADYVLMGYGTGAIMAVPGQDERDWEFAEVFDLPIIRTVQPVEGFDGKAFTGEGPAINSGFLDGMDVGAAKRAIIDWLETEGFGHGTVNYKLRDWLFSRQRYWGEPFPIVFDADGEPQAVPESALPVELPELIDWAPRALDVDSAPEPPLGRAEAWTTVEMDLGEGPRTYHRELNTMPQWAGSCWYYLRYLDPTNENLVVDPEVEQYWMSDADGRVGGVDLYIGGVEHAVLHLLYSRFWHKVLFDLGHVSGPEPFQKLFNQGYIQAYAYQDARGIYVDAEEVEEHDGAFLHDGRPVTQSYGKMGKSLKNSVTPDDMYESYGADTLRLHEMFMGPLDQDRVWDTSAVVGSQRLLQRVWRNLVDEETGEVTVVDAPASDDLRRVLHRTIEQVRSDMDGLRFNTAIAKITELNNELTKAEGPTPREVAEPLVLMLAPLVPHIAEELWAMLGHDDTVVYTPFPEADPALLVDESIEMPVQVNGKVRTRITVDAEAGDDAVQAAALGDARIAELVGDGEPRKVIVVPKKLVNIVL